MSVSSALHQAIKLFYSYSHQDEKLRDGLVKHLSLLKRQGVIADWHDRMIEAGDEWKREIDNNLETAQIILLLVSADFLASDYCYEIEMKRALERHNKGEARVIPIILRPVDWAGAPFAGLQALPKDAKPVTSWADRDKAFENIAKGIRHVIETLNSNTLSDRSISDKAMVRNGQPADAISGIGMNDISNSASLANEGLFMSRIINPQKRGAGNITSTVWLNVLGPAQYFVDSIHIQSVPPRGIFGSSGQVAIPPDAEYRFTYADKTDRIEALNPALSLGEETRRQASFTLSTAPSENLQSAAYGSLALWLLYHTSDNRTGKLLVGETSKKGKLLCQLLDQPVKVAEGYFDDLSEQVIVPPGISRGIDEHEAPFQFIASDMSLNIPYLIKPYDHQQEEFIRGIPCSIIADEEHMAAVREAWNQVLLRWAPLQQTIIKVNKLSPLVRAVAGLRTEREDSRYSNFVAELCGIVGDEQCTQGLLDLLKDRPFDSDGLHGLWVRHIIKQDSLLADYVIRTMSPDNKEQLYISSYQYYDIIVPLMCYPFGRWADALLSICKYADKSYKQNYTSLLFEGAGIVRASSRVFRILHNHLDEGAKAEVIAYCWEHLLRFPAYYEVLDLLVLLTGSAREVVAKMRNLPYLPEAAVSEDVIKKEISSREDIIKRVIEEHK